LPEPIYNSLWSPRFGLNWQVTAAHTLRFALQRHLNTHFFLQPLLVPTEVASFPWPIDAPSGAEVREVGTAWEAQWDPKTFSVLRLDAHRIAAPDFDVFGQRASGSWRRYLASLTVNRILTPYVGLNLGVVGRRIVPDVNPNLATVSLGQDLTEVFMFAGLNFLHRSGWQGGITTPLVFQHLKSNLHYQGDADNLFGLVNLRLGYEFPHKRGLASFEVTNLFNRHFFQALEPFRDPEIFPVRRMMFKLALWF
jgi:outer membrane receptor protein involved in Fe transport